MFIQVGTYIKKIHKSESYQTATKITGLQLLSVNLHSLEHAIPLLIAFIVDIKRQKILIPITILKFIWWNYHWN